MARPMPRAPPVTMAFRFLRSIWFMILQCRAYGAEGGGQARRWTPKEVAALPTRRHANSLLPASEAIDFCHRFPELLLEKNNLLLPRDDHVHQQTVNNDKDADDCESRRFPTLATGRTLVTLIGHV